MNVTTNRFDAEIRVDMMVPVDMIGDFKKGDDVTRHLMKTNFLNGYAYEEVSAITLGNGGKKVKVAFLWEDAGCGEMWYVNQKVTKGMNEERAMDMFYEVAQNLMD